MFSALFRSNVFSICLILYLSVYIHISIRCDRQPVFRLNRTLERLSLTHALIELAVCLGLRGPANFSLM
jgi:hypothetical protein